MADTIVPNVVVSMPSQLFTLARAFKAAANGKIYIGKIDTDPTIPENQIQVYLENEDGTHVPIAQPIIINSGGYPVYGGQIAKFVTVQGHSMAVYDAYNVRQFYFPNVLKYDPDQFKQWILEQLASPGGSSMIGFDIDVDYPAGTIGHTFSNIFKTEQYLQFYYDKIGNWDDAIFAAQMNVYLKGYSPKLIFPCGVIHLKKPILGAQALGDAIHAARPDLNFYNVGTGDYKATWPTIIEGTYRKNSDAGVSNINGTQLYLDLTSSTDTRYQNFGVIHAGPTEADQFSQRAAVKKKWPGVCVIRNINISAYNMNGDSDTSWCHGIVSFNGVENLIENVGLSGFWGGGIVFDWCWDSKIVNCKVLRSGRMMSRTDYADVSTDVVTRQLYSPLQVMMSPRGSGTVPVAVGDNSNFIRIYDCKFERNYGVADIMARGQSSPLWIQNGHHESNGAAPGSSHKVALCLGGGITQFMGDPSLGWNEGSSNYGAYAYWYGGAMYQANYTETARILRFSALSAENFRFPNIAKITISSGNNASKLSAVNCALGDIELSGGNDDDYPLTLTDCSAGNITMNFVKGIRLVSCKIASLNASNMTAGFPAVPCVFQGLIAGSITGTFHFAFGDVWLSSMTVASNYAVSNGVVRENFNAYAQYTGGYN
ncbi:phage head-binding domain-containing protein [Serratia quinivorans]|uniref:phage head-binding domain-containing protein n=1 Tax=Serratia quinivorans TaxID=137545 RepID=UPI003F714E2C